eukprot:CAMPEP_0204632814 /NCGR_PEP_ID=MMETSP0717-20131115/25745_1 /ASSEMBLY_ACC=CAM_ASM_000666 /TAXON_ID=230516 /ORGANISM="Chaetoceros curvisetus" /LENGTH=78 /DNA_ID=CAMNT_0051650767 /DNA_START=109 /DNA_END=342 /DNA_ORIENTATION=-
MKGGYIASNCVLGGFLLEDDDGALVGVDFDVDLEDLLLPLPPLLPPLLPLLGVFFNPAPAVEDFAVNDFGSNSGLGGK